MFRSSLIAALFAAASANQAVDTKTGSEALAKVRKLNQNNEDDFSWMVKYSMKFEGCHSIHTYGAEGQGGGNEEGGSPFGVQHLAKFKLCQSDHSCGACSNAGVYMVELREFAEAYLEAQQEMQEANCEAVQENCNCQYYYGDDQACLNKCYKDAGLDYCGEDQNDFNAAEFLECREADFGGNNYYGNNAQYYIGPVCSHQGYTVNLAVFTDAQCTVKAAKGTYEKYNYGYSLPYSSEPMIGTKCMSCKNQQNNNNGNNQYYNQYYQAEPLDTCTELYEQSAKCEKKMVGKNQYTRDTGSCDYIHNIVPALETVYHKGGSGTSTGLAVFFAITTIAAAGAAFFFYSKVERATVDLSTKEGYIA